MEGAVSGPRVRSGILGFGRDITILLVLLLAAGAVGGPARSLFPVYLERDLHWAAPAIAALTTARLLAAALSAPIGGTLADIAGPRRALWCGLLGLPVAASLFLLSVPPALIFLMLAIGVADGMQSTGSQSYLVTRASGKTIGLATGAFYVGSTLGGALGNLGAGTLLDGWGFRALGWAGLGGGLLVLVGALALPAGERSERRRAALGNTLAGYRPLLRISRVRQLGLLRFLSTCAWGTATFLWPILIARMSGDPGTAARFGTVSLALAVMAQLATGRLIDAIGPGRPTLVLACLAPVMPVLSAVAIASDSLPALLVVGVVGTSAAWSLSGTILPMVRATSPGDQVGQVAGLLSSLWSLAMLTGTLLAGWLVEISPVLPFVTVALLNLPTAVAAFRLQRSLRAAQA